MANLIDYSYFWGKLQTGWSGTTEQLSTANKYIALYEPEYLKGVLGQSLYAAYLATPTAQRFLDILNGKTYTYNDTEYIWQGLVNTMMKISPIANYVFFYYVRDNATSMTTVGNTSNTTENSTRVSPTDKLVFAWQGMAEVNISLYHFLSRNADTYPEFNTNIWYECNLNTVYYRPYRFRNVNPLFNPLGAGSRVL